MFRPRENPHTFAAPIPKARDAKRRGTAGMRVWGTGPRRDVLHLGDPADSLVFQIQRNSSEDHVKISSGGDVPMTPVARIVVAVAPVADGLRSTGLTQTGRAEADERVVGAGVGPWRSHEAWMPFDAIFSAKPLLCRQLAEPCFRQRIRYRPF